MVKETINSIVDQDVSKVVITFSGPGSAKIMNIQFEGIVILEQMLALAQQIRLMYENEFMAHYLEQMVKDQQSKLAVAKADEILVPGGKNDKVRI